MTAAKLIAALPMRVPNSEMVSPVHSFMKSAWRYRERLAVRKPGAASELSICACSRMCLSHRAQIKTPRASQPEAFLSRFTKGFSRLGRAREWVRVDSHWDPGDQR